MLNVCYAYANRVPLGTICYELRRSPTLPCPRGAVHRGRHRCEVIKLGTAQNVLHLTAQESRMLPDSYKNCAPLVRAPSLRHGVLMGAPLVRDPWLGHGL